jgi:CAP12/Pycsar effector protein, TIR domain
MSRPKVFIGSSQEGVGLANAVQANLDDDAECTVWNQGSFVLSGTNLGSLISASREVDFAVFVFSPDDVATIRDQERAVTRDNVLFEFGLFSGALGIERTFYIKPKRAELHLPTDLLGVCGETYNDQRDDHNLRAAVGPACATIRERLRAGRRGSQKASIPLGLARSARRGEIFQDFAIVRPGGNINPVSRLWADAVRANTINAAVDHGDRFLRVRFCNHEHSYPGNLTIRPQSEEALANPLPNAALAFEARVPALGEPGLLAEVGIAVRIINGWDQHWEWCDKPGEYVMLRVTGDEWCPFAVDLSARGWQLFHGDGHVHGGPAAADFTLLCGVVLEVGSYNVPGRPGAGSGALDVRRLHLVGAA